MSPKLSRLAIGDYLVGAGAVLLLVVLFGVSWYQVNPQTRGALLLMGVGLTANGWQTFVWIGPLCVLVGLLALAATWLQLTRVSPALPIVTTIVLAPLSVLLSILLVVRVLIAKPAVQLPAGAGGGLQTCAGAYIGLAAAVMIAVGAWLSLRRDGVDPDDSPGAIETLPLTGPPPSGPA